jgi:biotin carboxylase
MTYPKLNGLADIYTFFRKNTTPVYFVSPTAFNVLGLDQWVGHFEYINYFDSFDGYHPRVLTPTILGPPEFRSIEDVCNYLLGHKEVIAHFRKRGGKGKILLVMFDEETEELARDLGLEIALPPCALRKRLDSKIETTRLGNEAGVASVPNVLGKASSFAELMQLAASANLGDNLVVQMPYGDSGRTTFFIRNERDWHKAAAKIGDDDIKVMKYINHLPGTVEAVATRHGTLVGPVMTDITGFGELTPYKGGWCGNDIAATLLPERVRSRVRAMAKALGERLYQEDYRGCFCLDYLIDTDTDEVYLGEINPRVSGASPPTHLITSKYGGVPLMLFHLLEFMDVDYEVNLQAIQARWTDFDTWSQLILKQTEDKVELITKAPSSGVWRLNDDGSISFVRRALDWHTVADENEAFYLRVYGAGEYRYHGADLGILVARGRMQTDDRQLTERAKRWAAGINAQFEGSAPPPEQPVTPPEWSISKMF